MCRYHSEIVTTAIKWRSVRSKIVWIFFSNGRRDGKSAESFHLPPTAVNLNINALA